MILPFQGHLDVGGHRLANAGFMLPNLAPGVQQVGPSVPIYSRASMISEKTTELLERMQRFDDADVNRVDLVGDLGSLQKQLGMTLGEITRAITSTTTGFPVRENLEAPARILVPLETPVRNMLPRTVGAGLASAWRQVLSLGGGYGFATTVTTGTASATQTVGSTAGMQAGDVLEFFTATTGIPIGGTAVSGLRTVSSVTSATVVVLAATITTVTGDLVVNTGKNESDVVTGSTTAASVPGRPMGAQRVSGLTAITNNIRLFYAETGAPAEHTTVYASKSVGYKLMGVFGSVTGFAMAAGANYQPQLATEKRNAILNLMLNEESALINGSSTSVLPPWGDFTNALGFDGLINLITTANGVPADQVQSSAGGMTLSLVDQMLRRIWEFGGQGQWILASSQEVLSFVHLAEAAGSIIRLQATMDGGTVLGLKVTGYVHPVTGEIVPIMPSRFLAPGTMIFGSKYLPDGTPALDVNVLPQVELPALEPTEQIQGYVARELAVTTSAVDVHPFVVTCYEVLRMFGSTVFGKVSGLTAT